MANIDWIHRKAEYSILIGDRSFQRQGYGFESSMLLLEHGFSKLNLNRIWLGVHEHNELAIKLYTRLGFVEEGCLRQSFLRKGVYSNLKIMGLLSEEFYNLHHQHET